MLKFCHLNEFYIKFTSKGMRKIMRMKNIYRIFKFNKKKTRRKLELKKPNQLLIKRTIKTKDIFLFD